MCTFTHFLLIKSLAIKLTLTLRKNNLLSDIKAAKEFCILYYLAQCCISQAYSSYIDQHFEIIIFLLLWDLRLKKITQSTCSKKTAGIIIIVTTLLMLGHWAHAGPLGSCWATGLMLGHWAHDGPLGSCWATGLIQILLFLQF